MALSKEPWFHAGKSGDFLMIDPKFVDFIDVSPKQLGISSCSSNSFSGK